MQQHALTPSAAKALSRLEQLQTSLTEELEALPKPNAALVSLLDRHDPDALEAEIATLLANIDTYWQASSDSGKSRREVFIEGMEQALGDEVTLKTQNGSLDSRYASCIPASQNKALETFTLHIQLKDGHLSEISGALVFIAEKGVNLLALPGVGVQGFETRLALSDALVQWLNNEELRPALFSSAEQRDQELLSTISSDPHLYLEPFTAADLQLQPVTGKPFEHAFERQLQKQRRDVRHAGLDSLPADTKTPVARLEAAIAMRGLFGPGAMLEQSRMAEWERQQRKLLPDWLKIADQHDLSQYQQRLDQYELSRSALLSALGGAASHEQYARTRLRARLASDLGYDLEPGQVLVTTQRQLPITGESYTVSHSLLHLALYGLHPGDDSAGSAFMTQTRLTLNDAPMQASYPLVTGAYIARLIEELNLNVTFGEYQRTAYATEHNQQLMRELTRRQVAVLAWAAKMQGHIQQADFEIIEQIDRDPSGETTTGLKVQQIKLNDGDILSGVLIFCKNDDQGRTERLLMFAADVPRAQQFQGFDNPTQLLHELVSWTMSPKLSQYLLEQVPASNRELLERRFSALRLKPHPPAHYVQLITRSDYHQALGHFVSQHVQVAAADQLHRTPDWYLGATKAQRQELRALEEAMTGAVTNYQAKAHTEVQDFEAYVHQRASSRVSELLGVAEGSVDPDQIVITSEREVLSYTQMLRNGYDDSLGLLSNSADTQATFKGPEHVDLSPLTAQKVARSVHGQWLSDDYIKQIRQTLLAADSPGYEYRRQTSLLITVLQMKAAALKSFLKGQLDTRQYQWLKLSMDELHQTHDETRRSHPVYPLQLRLENPLIASHVPTLGEVGKDVFNALKPSVHIDLTQIETVQGCYLLSSPDTGQPTLLYTPQAPDGMEFRALDAFKASLSRPGMIDYYKDRCRTHANRKLAFFLRDMEQNGASKPPVTPKKAISDFHDICFNRPIERQLREVEDTTTGRSDMLSRLVWTSVELIAVAVTLPFPPASFAMGVTLAMRDSAMAFKAYADGDLETAGAYVLSSLFNSLGAGADASVGMKGFGALRTLRSGEKPRSMLASANRIIKTQPEIPLLPARFDDEMFWLSKPDADGYASVYRANANQSGHSLATGQLAQRDAAGQWQPLSQPPGPPANAWQQKFALDLSLKDATPLTSSHGKGVSLLDGKCYIELEAQVFEVQFDASARCWNIVDPQNPFAFFGKRPVQLNEQGQWQFIRRSGLRGGAGDSFIRLQNEATDPVTSSVASYELPMEMRLYFNSISTTTVNPMGWGFDEFFEEAFREMRSSYTQLRTTLYRDAKTFFGSTTPVPRPTLPQLDATAGTDTLIQKLYENSNGMVVSETQKSVASKRFLINNMGLLAEKNVEVLYIEHLFTDLHMSKLEKYRNLGNTRKAGSNELKIWLKKLNEGQLKNGSKEFDYYHLIKAAHQHGIEVRPFSSSVSYPLAGNPVGLAAGDIAGEQKMSIFFGHTLINADVAAHPSRRWVALLDQRIANTYQEVQGITELQGAISVRVQDVAEGQPIRVSPDNVNEGQLSSADFKVQLAGSSLSELNTSVRAPTGLRASPSRLDEALLRQIHGNAETEINNPYVGVQGFEWLDARGWQQVDPQRWPVDSQPTAIQLSMLDPVYSIPSDMRQAVHELAYFERRGLDSRYFLGDPEHSRVREVFFDLRNNLKADARTIITRELPARPSMIDVPPGMAERDFIESLYQHTKSVVIGESHSSIAGKKIIIDNLELLAKQDVKTLYLEHLLTDIHQADLDRFIETGHMSKALLHDLKNLDRGHRTDISGVYTYEQLVIKARSHGLDIRALDCASSYHLKGIAEHSPFARQQMFSYYASRTLRKHQEVMGSHKWVALVGNTHANTFENVVPGLAELEGGIGVRLIDVAPGTARAIEKDAGEALPNFSGGRHRVIKSDYRVEMEVSKPALPGRAPQPLPLTQRLSRPGMFLLEDGDNGLKTIVHRSRDHAIHRTPVMINPQGKFYVERARWPAVHLKPFDNLDTLLGCLEWSNMTRVS